MSFALNNFSDNSGNSIRIYKVFIFKTTKSKEQTEILN